MTDITEFQKEMDITFSAKTKLKVENSYCP